MPFFFVKKSKYVEGKENMKRPTPLYIQKESFGGNWKRAA
jgi:hypothetical protein